MKSRTYLRRLSREARWQLSPEPAEETIADYTELLEQDARTEKELYRDLGTPRQAVRLLDERHAYHKWLLVFAALSACILLPWAWLFSMEHHANLSFALWLAGAAGAVSWFRRSARKKPPLSRGLWPMLVLQAAALCAGLAGWGGIAASLNGMKILEPGQVGSLVTWLLRLVGTVALLTGLLGVVRARMSDRRWIALYTLGLTEVVICVQVLAHLHGMNIEVGRAVLWASLIRRCAAALAAGLIMSGVALC